MLDFYTQKFIKRFGKENPWKKDHNPILVNRITRLKFECLGQTLIAKSKCNLQSGQLPDKECRSLLRTLSECTLLIHHCQKKYPASVVG